MDVHLIDVYLMSVYLRRASHGRVPHKRASHGCAPHRRASHGHVPHRRTLHGRAHLIGVYRCGGFSNGCLHGYVLGKPIHFEGALAAGNV
jgi:hypothetical protein